MDVKSIQTEQSEKPQDRYNVILAFFFFLGLVHFLPGSFISTATEFWMYKFRNTTINESNSELRTDLQASFGATMSITMQISDVAFLFVGLLFGHHIKIRTRTIGILSLILIFFITVTIFVKVNTDSCKCAKFHSFSSVSRARRPITAGISSLNSVLTITLYTALSAFPKKYLGSYMTGGAVSSIVTPTLQIVSLATGLSVADSALVYFGIGLTVIASTLIFIIFATGYHQFYAYHMRHLVKEERRVTLRDGWRILKKIWSVLLMTMLLLLAAEASPRNLVVSEGEGQGDWNDLYFIPTITYLLSAICDLIGRGIGFRFSPDLGNFVWVLLAAIRTVAFVPLFLLCNAQPRNHLPVIFPFDYQYIIITICSGVSGGYLLTRCSYNISTLVEKDELKDAYHVFMILTGVQMGLLSSISIGSVKLL